MKIEKNHEIVGRKHSEIKTLDIGSLYPVLASDNETVVGVYSAEFGTPEGYELDEKKQAYILIKK